MTISINRRWADVSGVDGVSENSDSLEINYILFADNDEDEQDVLNFVQDNANIPHTYLGLFKESVPFDRFEDTENHWIATAIYSSGSNVATLPKLEVDQVRWSVVGGSGATVRRTFSRSLISETLGTGQTVPALDTTAAENAIGIVFRDGDYEIEGIDVTIGGTQVSVQTVWDYATAITGSRIVTASQWADQKAVNADLWNGFAIGTLQLDTFSARNRPGANPVYDIDMTFLFSPNLTSVAVGNGITVPAKKGHEILDVLYTKKEVENLPLPVPIRAAVHEVFPTINFATVLGV